MGISIRMAGFEIRDSIGWVYGSGFPKSLDVSKAIDKAAGAEREVIGTKPQAPKFNLSDKGGTNTGYNKRLAEGALAEFNITAPSTPEAQQWQGWGTAIKPALEPIVVARKPVEGTVANNVLTYGTGGLNIDASRIGTGEDRADGGLSGESAIWGENNSKTDRPVGGRWPANLILDEYTAELLDEQSGQSGTSTTKTGQYDSRSGFGGGQINIRHPDSGGASRFFYVAKASKRDRNEGLQDSNAHPTVKPTELMRYLVKLITPPGGTILDPFTGSGSTGKAAILEGFDFIGIELTEDYWPIIEGRLKHAEAKVAEAKENQEAEPQGLF
jgi:site-specific DNA-methyltransferase (adenine-specific)